MLTQSPLSTAFSSLIESRPTCLAIAGAVGTHASLIALGLPSWQCPIRYGLGIPCPGCGLSRAGVAMVHGDWHQMLLMHAFAPIAAISLVLILASGILPTFLRINLIDKVRLFETRTGVTALFLISLIAYWLVRLLFFHKALYALVM